MEEKKNEKIERRVAWRLMRTLPPLRPSADIRWQKNCSERTRRVIGHRVAILEHAETDGDGERGDGRARRQKRERMDRESERRRKTKEMKEDAKSETEMR